MAKGRCQTAVLAVVNIAAVILQPPSLKMFSTAAALAAVVAAVSLLRGGALLDPDGDGDGNKTSHTGKPEWWWCRGDGL